MRPRSVRPRRRGPARWARAFWKAFSGQDARKAATPPRFAAERALRPRAHGRRRASAHTRGVPAARAGRAREGERGRGQPDEHEVGHERHDDVGRHKVQLLGEVLAALGVLGAALGEDADAHLRRARLRLQPRVLAGRPAAAAAPGGRRASMPTLTKKEGSASRRSRKPLGRARPRSQCALGPGAARLRRCAALRAARPGSSLARGAARTPASSAARACPRRAAGSAPAPPRSACPPPAPPPGLRQPARSGAMLRAPARPSGGNLCTHGEGGHLGAGSPRCAPRPSAGPPRRPRLRRRRRRRSSRCPLRCRQIRRRRGRLRAAAAGALPVAGHRARSIVQEYAARTAARRRQHRAGIVCRGARGQPGDRAGVGAQRPGGKVARRPARRRGQRQRRHGARPSPGGPGRARPQRRRPGAEQPGHARDRAMPHRSGPHRSGPHGDVYLCVRASSGAPVFLGQCRSPMWSQLCRVNLSKQLSELDDKASLGHHDGVNCAVRSS